MAALLLLDRDCQSWGLGMDSDLNQPQLSLNYGGGPLRRINTIDS